MEKTMSSWKKGFSVFYAVFLILGIIIVGEIAFLLFTGKASTLFKSKSHYKPAEVIMTVGNEKIYGLDYDTEYNAYPSSQIKSEDQIKKVIMDKLTHDSVLLQGAADQKLIALTPDIFNSPTKDYNKRVKAVVSAETKVRDSFKVFKGEVVSMYIFNTVLGRHSYNEAKKIVTQKITKLYQDVKEKRITIEHAGQLIKADSSLKTIDQNYQGNAYLQFKVGTKDPITVYPDFDTQLRALKPGQVSELYLGKDKLKTDSEQTLDSVYMFGGVSSELPQNGKTFESWYAEQQKKYVVK